MTELPPELLTQPFPKVGPLCGFRPLPAVENQKLHLPEDETFPELL